MSTALKISALIPKMLQGSLPEAEIIHAFEVADGQEITAEDVAVSASAMHEVMVKTELPGDLIDTCGTGGSGKKTINTSTIVALIVATAGGKVAKHGNRSASGNCGCFDVLEALGAKIDLTVEEEQRIFGELGIVFLFARSHHPAMKHVAGARKTFGKPTIFNLLGPLSNPAGAKRQMIGVPNSARAELIAAALNILGTESSVIVTGKDGLDEVTLCDTTEIRRVPGGGMERLSPTDVGMDTEDPSAIEGGDTASNVAIVRSLLTGQGSRSHRNLVLLNAAVALTLTSLAKDIQEGVHLARETLDSGKVATLLENYIHATHNA